MSNGQCPIFVLQGPVGGFFGFLCSKLAASGYDVVKIQFNFADQLLQHAPGAKRFRGDLAEWQRHLAQLCIEKRPQAILLFGDRRPVHIVACEVAEKYGIPAFSFEEGYLRPDFVTLEQGGNNARSPIVSQSLVLPPEETPRRIRHVGRAFERMAWGATLYFVIKHFGSRFYPQYTHHRERPLVVETLRWMRNLRRKVLLSRKDDALCRAMAKDHDRKFFVVALQVHDDLQAVHHGLGWTQERLISQSIASFARNAPRETRLLIRHHPMDRGHRSYAPLVAETAAAHGVADRVSLLFNGSGPLLLEHAAGFVTVNSTMALSAMFHHCPVYALGEAFYKIDGLVSPGVDAAGLDAFWTAPHPVDAALFGRFREYLLQNSQINGNYYLPGFYEGIFSAVSIRLAEAGIVPQRERTAGSGSFAASGDFRGAVAAKVETP